MSKALGGSKFVHSNMMSNSLPLVGTKDLDWASDVREIVRQHIRNSCRY